MSDADDADGAEATAASEPAPADEASDADGAGPSRDDVFEYLEWGALGLCVLLVLFAGVNVYTSVGVFISAWVAPKYEPAFDAAFNLVVFLVAAYGAAVLSRRLTAAEEP